MEPEGSLPCSQEPSTGPHPQQDSCSPYHPILSKIHFNIILRLRLGRPSDNFLSGFPTNILMHYSSPCVLHALPNSSSWC
jgi:hypothetical protein